jgi:class 3 adenylate cyclase/tetratricopeptide (TPR) repeat protein
MKCPRCQAENPPGMRFCGQCAAPLAAVCPSCGSANPPGNKFCGQCATLLDGSKGSRFSAPEAYTPKHLAERIINSKAALEGERKQVTVLFADLKGSMELLADRDPEEARKLLDPVIEHMMEAVHRYEGTVNQVMGDGIMALFGAPLAHEDHAVRACYAALRMQNSVKRYAEVVQRAAGVPIQIRVGLNSGEVVVRSIGSDLRMDYTAVGQTTHLAARVEQMAMAGSILLSADALRLAEGFVEVKPLGPVNVKGLSEPVEVYEVTGAGPARTRLQAATRRGLTRFVGRDAEVEHLRRVLGQAGAGRGQVVAIVGEAGVGKSRLTYEFTHSHRVQDWLVLEASSVSYGKATSYLPVIDLLKGYFKIGDQDDHREMRAKVLGRVLDLDRALEPLLAPLLGLLDVPVEDAAWQTLDPPQRRQRTLDAVKGLLLRESQVQPLLVVFEDLHWIDGETQPLLDSLVDSLGSARLLLLVNYRPEYQHGWSSKTAYSQLRLDALPAESTGELLEALLGDDPGLTPLKRLLVRRGNPFFLEETVRTLIETKALAGERGRYRLTQPVQTLQVPATVQTILAARIDRLVPEDKRLLQTASVVGKDVPFALLQAIADLPDEALRRGLDRLQAAELLHETGLYPDLEYCFKHALTHEVTYGGVLRERRRALHARIVEAVEHIHSGRLVEHVDRLAEHAFRGERWEQAVAYLGQAGARALDRSAYAHALTCFDRALEALTHVPKSPASLREALKLRFDRGAPYFVLGQRDRQVENLEQCLALAETLGDEHWRARITNYMANALWTAGESARAVEFGEQALRMAEDLDDSGLLVQVCLDLGQIHRTIGGYRAAVAYLERATAALGESRDLLGRAELPTVMTRANLAFCLAQVGEFDRATELAAEAIRIAEAVGHGVSVFVAHALAANPPLVQGYFDRAITSLERATALCQSAGMSAGYGAITARLGDAYARVGRVSEALPLLEQALQVAARGNRAFEALATTFVGEAYLRAERLVDASAAATRALELSQQRAERGTEAQALELLGRIAVASTPPEVDAARAYYEQALQVAAGLGMRPLMAHCHLGLGKLYRRTGKREQAREHLTTATTMYREMGMTYWLEKAEAEMAELR